MGIDFSDKEVLELSKNIDSTIKLAAQARKVVVVDGSSNKLETLVRLLQERQVANVELVHADFFDFKVDQKFQEVILFRTLEHILDRQGLLIKLRE